MSLPDDVILDQNRWWRDPDWAARDPHLLNLPASPLLPSPAFVEEINLGDRSLHIVRGPRQVGKSTGLKQLAQRSIAAGVERDRVVYVSLDLLEGQPLAEAAATVRRAKDLAPGEGEKLVLLDEVTVIKNWQRFVKELWEQGHIRNDTVLCTGSSAIDLAEGSAEGLPGRRGAGIDYLVLPQSFAAFARALDPLIPQSPRLQLRDIFTKEGRGILTDARIHQPQLRDALDTYLVFGGLPAAVIEATRGAIEPSPATMRVLWDSISREVRRRGASEPSLQALLERAVRGLKSKTNWSTLAREMDAPLGGKAIPPHHHTVKSYIEFLGFNYMLIVVYFWKAAMQTNDLARDKKLYFGDPLLHTIVTKRVPGLPFDKPAAIENAVAIALYRAYEPFESQVEGSSSPERLHVWKTGTPREIDFFCGPRSHPELAEVKYQRGADLQDTLTMRNAFPRCPAVLVTIDRLEFANDHALVPAELLLWAVG